MSRVEEIEAAIEGLAPPDLELLARWFDAYRFDQWDRQIEDDAASGRLDGLIRGAEEDIASGRVRPLP